MTVTELVEEPGAGGGPPPALVERVRRAVIGDDQVLAGPYGPRRITYADWTASGRSLDFVEDAIRDRVLPLYANTHTETSGTGRHTTQLREQARQVIHRAVGGTDQDLVIFSGSGATAAVAKLVGLLELGRPPGSAGPAGERPVVFVGPFEHHSNLLPWRESAAEVVAIGEDGHGRVDLAGLEAELVRHAGRPLLVGSFSAASNVTGILSDSDGIAALLHRHGALSVWDYSAAAPYVPIRMGASRPGAGDHKDAVVFSPHKFIGRHPRDRRVDPGRAGRGPQAGRRDRPHPGAGAAVPPPRWSAGAATRAWSCSATWRFPGCRSSPSASATVPATCTTSWWWRC